MASFLLWIDAFRLRTLPLALSSIFLGSFLAYNEGVFSVSVAIFAVVTTLFLQISSNLANDYGDSKSGMDNDDRVGPLRSVQGGGISLLEMKRMMILFSVLSLVSGLALIYFANIDLGYSILFLVIGIGAIAAAINYTVGKKPFGYIGWGDFFVFLFFGLVGVVGTYYLHTGVFSLDIFLPASSVGMLSAAVLNLNNLRDRVGDEKSGKRTLVVAIGAKWATIYHVFLIVGSVIIALLYIYLNYTSLYQFLFLVISPVLIFNIRKVIFNTEPCKLDSELKKIAMATLLFSVLFGVGMIL
ncbi:MAG: 1,4-dihydroxy-2-naphthoate polyprenyltransferase [Bacteroidota bacterium]|nr:1,4-dihydroxy-2-naphthoate polyprenyltransferase [Bacteroidota bacterium]